MTAYNLGPPLDDEHDYLDGRRGRRGEMGGGFRRMLLTALALAVMALFGGGLWYAYRETAHRIPVGETPLLRADDRATKVRPEQPGGMPIPNQDSFIYNPGKVQSGQVERLLPPPEAPMARPAPPPPPPAEPAAAPAAPAAAAPPPGEPPAANTAGVAAPAGVPAAAPAPPPAAPAPVAPVSPPAPVAAAPVKPPAAVPPPSAKDYRVQLGALRTEEAARKEWDRLKRVHADLLGKLGAVNSRIDLGDRGTYYRIQAGPIAEAATAERICTELKRRNVGCILVRP